MNRYIRNFEFSLRSHTKAMHLTKFPVVLALLTASACRANIVLKTSRPDKYTSDLVEDVVNIVTSCYGDRIQGIGLAGNLPDTLLRALSVRHLIPVALIHNTYDLEDKRQMVPLQFQQKLHVFIVEASSFEQLDTLIEMNIKYSMWWNHMASFFILDMSPRCNNLYGYLYLAWQRNILNAKVMCYPRVRGETFILSYNPFTRQAPASWQKFTVFPGTNKHPFTVFGQGYRGNKTICMDLDFEKTKNLGGSVIRVGGFGRKPIRAELNRGSYEFLSKMSNIFTVFDALNATLKYSGKDRRVLLNNEDIMKVSGVLAYPMWNSCKTTYPHDTIWYTLISQFRGDKSQLNKILSVIDGNSRYGMVIVFLITLIFFKFFVRQAFGRAILNVVRINFNTGLRNVPDNTPSRIYLASLLFFVVTMHGIYKSRLAVMQTTHVSLPNVHTVQDLDDFGYKEICVVGEPVFLANHPVVRKNVIRVKGRMDCFTRVRNNQLTAYVDTADGVIFYHVRDFNLHMSSNPIISLYTCFYIQWDWPLEERVNIMIQKLVEADILYPQDVKRDRINPAEFEIDEAVKNNQAYKNLGLSELSFAFVILVIGLTFATVTLIIELGMQYKFLFGYSVFITRREYFW